jgi:hypothetical protein
MSDRHVTISEDEYESLLDDRKWRLCLESGGVDNWEWYGESLCQGGYYEEDDTVDDDTIYRHG